MVTGAHHSGESGGGEVTAATETRSDINQVGGLGTLASAMQLLQVSPVPLIRVNVPTNR